MKRLILLRHAKSSWVNPDLDDFDRPLNKRGKRGAKALGKWLRGSEFEPDRVLCSTARRARETLEALKLGGSTNLHQELYHASPDMMLRVLAGTDADTVMMIGHNPGIGILAQALVKAAPDHPRFADYPTGALLVVEFDIGDWSNIPAGSGQILAFLTPHDLTDSHE